MIVCIPGARRCYQRAWRVDLGCWIYVHNLRDCAKMDEMFRALLFAPHTSHLTPHTSHLTLHISHVISQTANLERLTLPTSSVTLTASHYPLRASARRAKCLPPHTSSVGPVATNDCSGKHAVSSGTQSSGSVAMAALGAPVNDNHSHLHR